MMEFYNNSIIDKRTRRYLPVSHVLACENVENPEGFIGSTKIQQNLGAPLNSCRFARGGFVLLDFGIEFHGGIRILSRTKTDVRLRFGESAGEAMGAPDQDHAIHDAIVTLPWFGMLEYGNTAFRFVRVDNLGDNELVIDNVIGVALYHDLEWSGSFESSDELLNRIWKTGVYTVLLNMQDYIYDGAKRDRLVWMGDLNPEIRTILAVFNDTELIRKSMDFMREETILPKFMNGIDTYSLWYIINVWEYFFHTGSLDFLTTNDGYISSLVDIFQAYIDPVTGSEMLNGSRFIDWQTRGSGNIQAVHSAIQGLMLWAFNDAKKIFSELGRDTNTLDASIRKLITHIPDPAGSKAAAALMTLSGLNDSSKVILNDLCNGVGTFYGTYILESIPTVPALCLIRSNWGAMLDRGATTFWEDFDPGWLENSGRIDELPAPGQKDIHADFGNFCYKGLRHSLCHGWASGPTSFLSKRVLGIKFLQPGGTKIAICPDLGGLEFVSGRMPTPRGLVSIVADQSGKVEVTAPAGVEIVKTHHGENAT